MEINLNKTINHLLDEIVENKSRIFLAPTSQVTFLNHLLQSLKKRERNFQSLEPGVWKQFIGLIKDGHGPGNPAEGIKSGTPDCPLEPTDVDLR